MCTSKLSAQLEGISALILLIVTGVILGTSVSRLEVWKRPALIVSYGLLLSGLTPAVYRLLAVVKRVERDTESKQNSSAK